MIGHVLPRHLTSGWPVDRHAAFPADESRQTVGFRWPSSATRALLLGVSYYAGAQLGFALQSPTVPQSILWLPNSIVLAILLVEPARRWPIYLLAALPAQLLIAIQAGEPLPPLALLFVTNCADAMLGAGLVRRLSRGSFSFRSLRGMLTFMVFAAMLSPVMLSFADAAITVLTHWGSDYWAAFATRVRSNTLTHLVAVPAIVMALGTTRAAWVAIPVKRYVEAVAVLGGLVVTAVAVFDPTLAGLPPQRLPAPFLLPFLVYLAVRFGSGVTAFGLLIMAAVASWDMVHPPPHLTTLSIAAAIATYQLFIVGMAIPLLCLATVMEEREDAMRRLAHMGRVATSGELAATLSHELLQPLTAILSNAQAGVRFLAAERPPLAELKALLEDIVADDTRATSVIERIRALLRDEQPRMDAVDLNEACRGVETIVRKHAAMQSTRFTLELDPSLPPVVGDAIQLQEVVLNLVLNALEAAAFSRGYREVSVTTAKARGLVVLSVRDSGNGLSRDVEGHLFQPFFSTKPHGLGMGLAIVWSIVDRHRGSVRGENSPQGGAVFQVALPAKGSARTAGLVSGRRGKAPGP